jgi:outer membrane receptor protein involved in Fe transport
MRYCLVVLSLFFSFSTNAADTTGIVKGKVFDNISREPLVGANIIYGESRGTITDKSGYYYFKTGSGNLSISFQYVGYKSLTKSVLLQSNDTIELNAGLEQEINEIDQIVVSANRKEQKVSESTVSLSIIRPDILEKNHITDAEDLINKTSGIEILDGQASIRGGSGFSYGAGSRVLALIDGLPVVATDAGNVKWQFLPLENLSQIEIIKGASSVLYGSSALNGIINFRTADAVARPSTRFYLESGLYDKPKQKSWIWWDSPRIFTAASFSHLQKYGKTDVGIGSTMFTDNGYRRLNDEKLGRVNISVKHHNGKVDGLTYGLNLNAGLTVKRDFLLWENADSGALRQDTSTVLQLHGSFFALDPFITLKKTDRYKHDLRMRMQSSRNKFPEKDQNNSDALSYFAEYQGWYKVSDFLNLNFGVSENYSRIISNFYGNHEGLNLAGMSQIDISPVDKLKLIAGLRLEYNSLDGKSDKIVPIFRTGINFRASNFTFLRASFGQGYRYPSIAEKHASTTLGAVKIFPNPFIMAESGWNSEIGIKQGIRLGTIQGQADLALFYTQNRDLIEFIFGLYPAPASGIYDYGFKATNVEQSRVYGFELESVLYQTFGQLNTTLSGGYVFMYPVEFNPITKKNTDIYLKYRRKHSGKFSLNTSYKKVEMGFDLFVKSKILNIDDVFLNEMTRESILPGFYEYWNNNNRGYFLMDGNLGYNLNERFQLSLAIRNITNTEYMGRPGDIRPQRSFSLRFTGRFL